MTNFVQPYELSDAELDAVAAGAPLFVGGLANVNLSDIDVQVGDVLSGFDVTVDALNNSIRDFAKDNNVGVGAIIQALGGVAGIRSTQVT